MEKFSKRTGLSVLKDNVLSLLVGSSNFNKYKWVERVLNGCPLDWLEATGKCMNTYIDRDFYLLLLYMLFLLPEELSLCPWPTTRHIRFPFSNDSFSFRLWSKFSHTRNFFWMIRLHQTTTLNLCHCCSLMYYAFFP